MTRLLTSCFVCLFAAGVQAVEPARQARGAEDYQETRRTENLDPSERARVEALVVELAASSVAEMTAEEMDPTTPAPLPTESTAEREQRLAVIRDSPGLKPYLFDLLDTHYRRLQSEGVPSLLRAIASRDDLEPDEVAVIRTELQQILRTPYREDALVKNSYLAAGVRVLEKHPSPDHEAIAIGILKRGETAAALEMKAEAAGTLAVIGTKRSLQAMRAAAGLADSLSAEDSELDPAAARISEALARLEQRVGASESSRLHDRATTSARKKLGQTRESGIRQPMASPAGSAGWQVTLAAGLLVVLAGGAWLHQGRAGRS